MEQSVKTRPLPSKKTLLAECLRVQISLARLGALLGESISAEMVAAEAPSDEVAGVSIIFESASQKTSQYVNMLSSVLKAMNEMENGVVKNLK